MVQALSTALSAAKDKDEIPAVYLIAVEGYITTTLSAGITAAETSIQTASVADFPSSGILKIGDEYIYYSSNSTTSGALDTENKRRSAAFRKPFMTALPVPDGSIDANDRKHAARLYRATFGGSGTGFTVPTSLGRGSLGSTAAAHDSGATVRVVYVFNSAPVAGRESNTAFRMLLDPPKGVSQKVFIEEGRTELGTLGFMVQDEDEQVTGIITANSFAFRNKLVRFMMGTEEIQEHEYAVMNLMQIKEVKQDNTLARYQFTANDLQRSLKERISFGNTKNTSDITDSSPANGETLNIDSTTGFASVGYVRINDEIIQYTAKTASTVTGITRAADGTTAAEHSAGDDASEVVIIQDNPINLVLKFMLTQEGDASNGVWDVLDSTKGLGISQSLLVVSDFTKERDDYVPTRQYKFVLEADDMDDFLGWAQEQIMKTIPASFITKGTGQLSMKVSTPAVSTSDPKQISESQIKGNPQWNLGARNVINEIEVAYDWHTISGKFTQKLIQINASSQAKHGQARNLIIEAKGIRTSLDASTIAQRIIDFFDHRFSEPAPDATLIADFSDLDVETGDIILFSHEEVPNLKTGVRGVVDLPMEVAERTHDYKKGQVKIVARDINRGGKYGSIAPTLGIEDTGSAFPDYTAASARERRYAFIADTSTELMSNGDAATLII
ncbi:hypothetical protein N9937_00560 [bacterium]|nr:hypothetical protein [bacterium]